MTAEPDRVVVMGEILGPYGVRGWLKVRSFAEAPDTLLEFAEWWLRPKGGSGWRKFSRPEGRLHSGSLVVALEAVDTREAALALKGFEIGIPRAALPAPQGEIFWEDLKGLAVYNRSGARLGEVHDIFEHGAHPVLRVAAKDESGRERLIPYVPAIVDRVDVEAGRIDVDWEADY